MKILVGYKRVVDYNVRMQVKPDGSGVVTEGVKLSANPFDEIALEEALRLREKGIADRSRSSPRSARPTPRRICATAWRWAPIARSMSSRPTPVQPLTAARVLLKLIEKEQPDLVHPRQAGDRRRRQPDRPDAGRAMGSAAGDVRLEGRDRRRQGARVTREVDAGLETIEVDLPAVITTDLRLNEPRFIKLPDIMKAKAKPIETIAARRSRRRIGRSSEDDAICAAGEAQQGRDGEGCGRAGRCAEDRRGCCDGQGTDRRRTLDGKLNAAHRARASPPRRRSSPKRSTSLVLAADADGVAARGREDRRRDQGTHRRARRERACDRRGAGAAGRRSGAERLHACVRPSHDVRQGPDAARRRIARRRPGVAT